mmetsp:Transcript_14570/g.29459  ORF Transcript_14570/g.29459 Transcript_14570/m.29459 type:complete len:85 (+) Transcript_14570:1512-1766(+)
MNNTAAANEKRPIQTIVRIDASVVSVLTSVFCSCSDDEATLIPAELSDSTFPSPLGWDSAVGRAIRGAEETGIEIRDGVGAEVI